VSDLAEPTWTMRVVNAASRWTCQVAAAWREPRTQRLLLPSHPRQLTLGRSRRCDLPIADRTVSRRHAVLQPVDGGWWLRDVGSQNGTWVNGWRLIDQVEVRPGDEVRLGRARFILA
jgi:predicted component of type VI protein secretion system